ncbi:hypothetical protein J2I47_04860 [Fibrella sp. HMF5335]|uniref:Uncharacterized protein n=1 Tax=Fibrella rubiginis TaxID=2817060 RepID=A0A939GFP8_9BACT|nr:hypothetical protein [Fibrella rubiginis]MBO0935871.1 hypothetical protein [Fibrella rubiginis]
MNISVNVRSAFVALLLVASLAGQAQPRKAKAPIVSREGSWVIEMPARGRQCVVRFYTDQSQLIYEERLTRRLNINRAKTKRNLNAVLEKTLLAWNKTHQFPADRQLVAGQFDRK